MKAKISIDKSWSEKWQVDLHNGEQAFSIGPDWDTKAEAVWFKKQFARALKKLKTS
jgi:hypothetical protein